MTNLGYGIKPSDVFSLAFMIFVFHSARVLTGEVIFFALAIFLTALSVCIGSSGILNFTPTRLATIAAPFFAIFVWQSNGLEASLKNWIYIQSDLIAALLLLNLNTGSLIFLSAFVFIATWVIIESFVSFPDYAAWLPGSRNHVMPILFSLILISLFASNSSHLIKFRHFTCRVFIPVSLLCVVSILCVGLSGIVSALFLLLAVSIFALKNFHFKKSIILIAAGYMSILAIALVEIYMKANREVLTKLQNATGEGRLESPITRIDIWMDYFAKSSLLFGADYSQAFSGFYNLHNSFLLAHAKFGILFLVFPTLILISAVKLFLMGKQYQIFCFLLCTAGFRCLFDTIYFSGSSYTYQLFALILLPFFVEKSACKEKTEYNPR